MSNKDTSKMLKIIDINAKKQVKADNLKLGPEYAEETNLENKEDYFRFYVGSNYEKISKRFFNFSALLIPYFYFLYRKMFSFAIYLFILFLAIITITGNILYTLPINLFCFLFANKIYMKKVQIGFDSTGQKGEKLRKRGGTSIINILTGTIVMFLIFFGVTLLLRIGKIPTLATEALYLKPNGIDMFDIILAPKKEELPPFDGSFSIDTTENIKKTFNATPTSTYIEDNTSRISYKFSYASERINCDVTFFALEDYKKIKPMLFAIEDYYKGNIIDKNSEETINDITWNKISYRKNSSKMYHYFTYYNNKIYNYQMEIIRDENNKCIKQLDLLLRLVTKK